MADREIPNPMRERAEALYAARSAMADTAPIAPSLGVAEIVRFLSGSGGALSTDQQRALFSNPKLRADFQRLKARVMLAEMPALAAASAGNVKTRRFGEGSVNIHPSRLPGQSYVMLRFNELGTRPSAILLEGTGGEVIKRSLPAADDSGEIVLVLNEKNPHDANFLRLLADPTSTGSFLQ